MTAPNWSLVVLAAGIGSRYEGDKQVDPVGPVGELLSDYSVRDAARCGAAQAVFVIRPELEAAFRDHHRGMAHALPVVYAHQRFDGLPPGRGKPWGTTDAVLAARPAVPGGCVVVNADDSYGPGAIALAAAALPDHAVVGYRIGDTLSPHGGVSRALLRCTPDGMLAGVEELRDVRRPEDPEDPRVVARRHDAPVALRGDELVSMNCWAFGPGIWPVLADDLDGFRHSTTAPLTAECALPETVGRLLAGGRLRVRVLPEGRGWLGITHREDRAAVMAALADGPA